MWASSRPSRRVTAQLLAFSLGLALVVASASASARTEPSAVPAEAGQAATDLPGGKWEPGPARYGAVVVRDMAVTMDDGVVLDATVVYPATLGTSEKAAGSFPVVIEHTPYVSGPNGPNTYLTEHGYIYAVVQTRGAGKSHGELQRFSRREGLDGKAIVDWAAHQLDGSDGRIALSGCSYPAVVALNTAAYVGPDSPVKAILAVCAGLNLNRATLMVAGMPTTSLWEFLVRGRTSMGSSAGADRFFTRLENDIVNSGDAAFEREFWGERANMRLTQDIAAAGMPVLLWAGWKDTNNAVALRTFTGLQNAYHGRPFGQPMAADQPTTPRYQILMGDWAHGGGLDRAIQLQWLETWVKGVDTGLQTTSTPMHLFETGSGRWVNAARYPVVDASTSLRLAADGRLGTSVSEGEGSEALTFGDPEAAGGRISFASAPYAEGATIAGPIGATFFVSADTRNILLLARLYDVAPDDTAILISRGVVLGSQSELDPHQSWKDANGATTWPWPRLDQDRYLTPEDSHRLEMALEPIQHALKPGHRLRLDLTTQASTDICPVEGLPRPGNNDPCRGTKAQLESLAGGHYAVHFGPAQPSSLNLPLLPLNAFPTVVSGPPTAPTRANSDYTLPRDWGH